MSSFTTEFHRSRTGFCGVDLFLSGLCNGKFLWLWVWKGQHAVMFFIPARTPSAEEAAIYKFLWISWVKQETDCSSKWCYLPKVCGLAGIWDSVTVFVMFWLQTSWFVFTFQLLFIAGHNNNKSHRNLFTVSHYFKPFSLLVFNSEITFFHIFSPTVPIRYFFFFSPTFCFTTGITTHQTILFVLQLYFSVQMKVFLRGFLLHWMLTSNISLE